MKIKKFVEILSKLDGNIDLSLQIEKTLETFNIKTTEYTYMLAGYLSINSFSRNNKNPLRITYKKQSIDKTSTVEESSEFDCYNDFINAFNNKKQEILNKNSF